MVPTENVRAALAAVESGNAEAGIVYKTDAGISKKVKIAYEVPAADGPKISYPFAMIAESKHPEAARKLLSLPGVAAGAGSLQEVRVSDPVAGGGSRRRRNQGRQGHQRHQGLAEEATPP